jgi:NAD(P)-dependent dehydrogenase (short-subunit alcohol dehydrogenase family)
MLGPPGEPLDGDLMDLGLQDRVALVTGGSRGLGLAAAHALVADGARVLLSTPREHGGHGRGPARAGRCARSAAAQSALSELTPVQNPAPAQWCVIE